MEFKHLPKQTYVWRRGFSLLVFNLLLCFGLKVLLHLFTKKLTKIHLKVRYMIIHQYIHPFISSMLVKRWLLDCNINFQCVLFQNSSESCVLELFLYLVFTNMRKIIYKNTEKSRTRKQGESALQWGKTSYFSWGKNKCLSKMTEEWSESRSWQNLAYSSFYSHSVY